MANIVLNRNAGAVIKVGNVCYSYSGRTNLHVTGQEPDQIFSDCLDCVEAPTPTPSPTPLPPTPTPTPPPVPTPTPIPTPTPQDCGEVCDSCPTLNLVVSGLTGQCDGNECTDGNGPYTLIHPDGLCAWSGNNGSWSAGISCSEGRWILNLTGPETCAAQFSVPNTGGCPPSSGWVKDSSTCSGLIVITLGPGDSFDAGQYYCVNEDDCTDMGCGSGCVTSDKCVLGVNLNSLGLGNCWNGLKYNSVNDGPYEANDCDCESPCNCPTPAPVACPSDCSGCSSSLTVTISGMTGLCGGKDPCTNMNEAISMTRTGCSWSGSGSWVASAYLACTSQKWYFVIDGVESGNCGRWEANNTTGCPPASGWVKVSGGCTGGSITVG